MTDRYEQLDGADRWFFDILRVQEPAGFFVMEDVEMTKTQELIAQMRRCGIKGTYTHMIIRATALAFMRHPEFNRLIVGKQLVYPGSIDLGLTVGSDAAMAGNPTMILHNMEQKDLMQVAREVMLQAPIVRKQVEITQIGAGYSVQLSSSLAYRSYENKAILHARENRNLSRYNPASPALWHPLCLPWNCGPCTYACRRSGCCQR